MSARLALADLGARALRLMDPERAHAWTVRMMASGLGPRLPFTDDPRLKVRLAGLEFPNPIGLAAGFDKNAQAPDAMLGLGFGFVEVGAATPRPQAGNDRPRVFRLPEDRAVINRYGFNNDGLEKIAARLERRAKKWDPVFRERDATTKESRASLEALTQRKRRGVVGVNLGANKDSADRAADYVEGVRRLDGLVDFYTVNISSPNTPGLRALQGKAALTDLLTRVLAARDALKFRAPVFLKAAPDLADEDKADIADTARALNIDALVISNTTIARSGLKGRHAGETGGLSGAPLFAPSTRLLAEFHEALQGAVPLIGVGGVFSARDAYEKILAGACLVQLYTALIYEGPGLVRRILAELPGLLDADGFARVSDAAGKKAS